MVVDASVLAKLFSAEAHSDEARRIVADAAEVWVPAHAMAELGEILLRKIGLGEMTDEQCKLAMTAAGRLVRTMPLRDLMLPALDIARELGISVYDALYVSLALHHSEAVVTWDKRLLRKTRGTRFDTIVRPLHAHWDA